MKHFSIKIFLPVGICIQTVLSTRRHGVATYGTTLDPEFRRQESLCKYILILDVQMAGRMSLPPTHNKHTPPDTINTFYLPQLATKEARTFFSILLTHEGSHREVYWDFQPSLTSSAGGAKGCSDHRFRAPPAYTA